MHRQGRAQPRRRPRRVQGVRKLRLVHRHGRKPDHFLGGDFQGIVPDDLPQPRQAILVQIGDRVRPFPGEAGDAAPEGGDDGEPPEVALDVGEHPFFAAPPGGDVGEGEFRAEEAARERRHEGQHRRRFDKAGAEALIARYVDSDTYVPRKAIVERMLRFPKASFVYSVEM